jgi:hypothetical protein
MAETYKSSGIIKYKRSDEPLEPVICTWHTDKLETYLHVVHEMLFSSQLYNMMTTTCNMLAVVNCKHLIRQQFNRMAINAQAQHAKPNNRIAVGGSI